MTHHVHPGEAKMPRTLIALVIVALAAAGAFALGARGRVVTTTAAAGSYNCTDEACGPEGAAPAAREPGGKLTGRFDPAMSGVCRFACAAKVAHEAADVVAQPGAVGDRLTQCPVSGVVFLAEEGRPRVKIGGEEYVTCCDRCAEKLTRDPRRYLRS
jgi:hypothetical protein